MASTVLYEASGPHTTMMLPLATSHRIVNITISTYNFAGEVTATTRQHIKDGSTALTVSNSYQYDHAGRKTQTTETINSQGAVTTTYTYNAVGQLETRTAGGQTTSYKYNPRGWIKEAKLRPVYPAAEI